MTAEDETMHFLVHPVPGSEQQLLKRLDDTSRQLNTRSYVPPIAFRPGSLSTQVKQIAVGPNDAAFLFQDGTVARLRLSVFTERVDLANKVESAKSAKDKPAGGAGPETTSSAAKIRRAMLAARSGRSGRGVIVGSRPVIPASAIPEDLIAQAQVVLQGKSRELIVRELQRTNLNVNEAVNNLLSRDDDDPDDLDDSADAYLPEELLTLLDAGLHSGPDHTGVILDADAIYSSDVFDYVAARDYARRRLEKEHKDRNDKRDAGAALKYQSKEMPLVPGPILEMWKGEEGQNLKFSLIGATHSELLAVSQEEGQLQQWLWSSDTPHPGLHPKWTCLKPNPEERITQMECSVARTTFLTNQSRAGSFVDQCLGAKVQKMLDSELMELPEPNIVSIHTCPLFSCVRVASGAVFWWGVLPFNERRKRWEKVKSKSKKHVTFDTSEVQVGSQVRLRANPIYPAGSLGFTLSNGFPQVGELMEAAWTLTETCRFRVKSVEEMNDSADKEEKPEPLPAVDLQIRKRPATDEPYHKEEAWSLKDVTFVDEGKLQDFGKVVMVDGAYCGVLFPNSEGKVVEEGDVLKAMRLMRKDDLQVMGSSTSPKSPETFQLTPKKLALPHGKGIVDLMVDCTGIRVLVERKGKLHLMRCSVLGKVGSDYQLPLLLSAFKGTQTTQPSIINYGDENVIVVRDGNGCLVPLHRDAVGGYREPPSVHLPPISNLGLGIHPLRPTSSAKPTRLVLTVLTFKSSRLMQLISNCDLEAVKTFVSELAQEKNLDKAQQEIVNARIDGNRNILHAAILNCTAKSNRENGDPSSNENTRNSGDDSPAAVTRSLYDARWEQLVTTRSGAFSVSDVLSGRNIGRGPPDSAPHREDSAPAPIAREEPELMDMSEGAPVDELANIPLPANRHLQRPIVDAKQRQQNSLEIVRFLCQHSDMTSHLLELLLTVDGSGQTPFMLAVSRRAYSAALCLWETAVRLARATSQYSDALMEMIYPAGSRPDDSPLLVLCYNDTCSFTWTGDEHINQDIFECRTCGLVGSLCCCTECAFVCHKNHDCQLKRTSPTAYCDCWEKCACKALVSGNQQVRSDLLNKLLSETDLVTRTNAKGEHILLFLARTVGRQATEQRQCRPPARSKAAKADPDTAADMPEHDLEPPKFARRALERLLNDWKAVKSMVNLGSKQADNTVPIDEDTFYLNSQHGVSYLDRFMHTLLGKCNQDMLDTLLTTLIREAQRAERDPTVHDVVSRLVRSLVRVFVVLSVCSASNNGKRKNLQQTTIKCRRAFQALITYSLTALGAAADAVLAPVRMGLLKPTQSFQLVSSTMDVVDVVGKLFANEPVPVSSGHTSTHRAPVATHWRSAPNRFANPEEEERPAGDNENNNQAREEAGSDEGSDSESDTDVPANRTDPQPAQNTAAAAATQNNDNTPRERVFSPRPVESNWSFANAVAEEDGMGEEESRDIYYSDGDSVASGSSRLEHEDEHMDEQEPEEGEEDVDREDTGEGDVTTEETNEGEDESEHESDSDENEQETPADSTLAANTRSALGALGELERSSQSARVTAASELYTRTRAAPTLSWAVRRRGGESLSSAVHSMNSNAATLPSNTPPTSGGAVPPPERGRGSFYIVDTSMPPPTNVCYRPSAPSTDQLGYRTLEGAQEAPTTSCTAALLARTFGLIVRQIADLVSILFDYRIMAPNLPCVLVVNNDDANSINSQLSSRLEPCWLWLCAVLDSVEAQLKFGSSLAQATDPTHSAPANVTVANLSSFLSSLGASAMPSATTSRQTSRQETAPRPEPVQPTSTAPPTQVGGAYERRKLLTGESDHSQSWTPRRDFVHYLLSLLRAQSSEHGDDFPVMDISSLRHVAYVADAFFYLLDTQSKAERIEDADMTQDALETQWPPAKEEPKDETPQSSSETSADTLRRFFQRSKSLLYPGISHRMSAFEHSVRESLPLAEKPHLLRPETPRDKMFGIQRKLMTADAHMAEVSERGHKHPTHQSLAATNTRCASPTPSTNMPSCETPVSSTVRKVMESAVAHTVNEVSPTKRTTRSAARLAEAATHRPQSQSVIVHASRIKAPDGVAPVTPAELTGHMELDLNRSQVMMGRWKLGLTVLAKVFSDELSSETGSVLVQMAGFPVRESRFRKEMEKLRSAHSKDLVLEVDRERHLLIQQTIKQINMAYNRRSSCAANAPLAVHKVKVTFKDEPGEGSGVARSFYAAIAEALLSPERLPNLEHCQSGPPTGGRMSHQLFNRLRRVDRERSQRGDSLLSPRRRSTTRRYQLSADAPPFFVAGDTISAPTGQPTSVHQWDPSKQTLGERIYPRVRALRPSLANKITGMLLELPPHQLISLLTHEEALRAHVEDAVDLVLTQQNANEQRPTDPPEANAAAPTEGAGDLSPTRMARKSESVPNLAAQPGAVLDPDELIDNAPLFTQPGKSGFYTLVPGKQSAERLNAFRNVGRLMGICLQQNEVFPLYLCRHVLKYILGRPINWYDLAFFDSALFESLRIMAQQSGGFEDMAITFAVDLSQEEGGGTIELKAGGANIAVTKENVIEYIYRFVEQRMLRAAEKSLEAMRQGVFDVLPPEALKSLTAEDLRLILCGTHEISSRLLHSYTRFSDESSAAPEQLTRFKRWFWSVLNKMNAHERQELVYFWTGSPALPSSEEGFQPLPSVMIRPADDHHLPTANTCISRLYLPLYSSKHILRHKLMLAIKARNFGFV